MHPESTKMIDTVPIGSGLPICSGAGGMVAICAGTKGHSAMVGLRYHRVRQKRLQDSHGTHTPQARAFRDLICAATTGTGAMR